MIGEITPMDITVATRSISVAEDTQMMLEELARLDGVPVSDVLARAVETYWRRRINEASEDSIKFVDMEALRDAEDAVAEPNELSDFDLFVHP